MKMRNVGKAARKQVIAQAKQETQGEQTSEQSSEETLQNLVSPSEI